ASGSLPDPTCEVKNHCKDPPDYWTIHGLWPDKSEGCNRSWHFNPEEIKPLQTVYWEVVSLLFNQRFFKKHPYRKHEWEKHGTCAAQLEALNSQKKYFGKSLDLSKELALNSTLQKLGITPSTYYQISDIKDALVSVYGVVPKVQCLPKQGGEQVQLLAQIEVCFSKDLQLQNCMDPGEPAPRGPEARPAASLGLEVCKDGVLFYPALNKTNH
uniref:Ribonuclease T2 n=1 Tax=Balaenoptera musculus TaxID=9771 RepID=A0A8C0CZI4_BALMU